MKRLSRVLLLSREDDIQTRNLSDVLRLRGSDPLIFDPGKFPQHAALSFTIGSGVAGSVLTLSDQAIRLDELSAVWLGRPSASEPHQGIPEGRAREYAAIESGGFSEDFWDSLQCTFMPARNAVARYAARKIRQLVEAGRIGFDLPHTLATTDPDDLIDFYCDHDGDVITKAMTQMSSHFGDQEFGRFTESVSTVDILAASAVRNCPVIAQSKIAKAVEIRATVVGSRIFAAEIDSQGSNRTRDDWRRGDSRMISYSIHRLPEPVARRCQQLVHSLGLCFGAVDLILTPDGRYVFLEVNPTGQYLWIEQATGLPITQAMCNVLLGAD